MNKLSFYEKRIILFALGYVIRVLRDKNTTLQGHTSQEYSEVYNKLMGVYENE